MEIRQELCRLRLLADEYGQRLRRFLSVRLRDVQDIPDLAQEVFLRLLRVNRHELIRNPESYLFTVASHVAYQHTLRRSAQPVSVDITEALTELDTGWAPTAYGPPRELGLGLQISF